MLFGLDVLLRWGLCWVVFLVWLDMLLDFGYLSVLGFDCCGFAYCSFNSVVI